MHGTWLAVFPAIILLSALTADANAENCAENLGAKPTAGDFINCLVDLGKAVQEKSTSSIAVLNDETERSVETEGNSAQSELSLGPYHTGAAVFVSASGTSSYRERKLENAGIVLSIFINENVVATDDSFEGESSKIDFHASASHTFYLREGTTAAVKAEIEDNGTGNNKNTKLRLSVVALAAAKQ